MKNAFDENEIIRILAVDDEPFVLDTIKRLLNEDNYDVLTATSGAEGLLIMETHPVQIVISDYRMPEMNGVEFLKEVYRKWPDTIRIVLSGFADIQSVIAAINEGQIYKFMGKPWNNEELRIAVVNAIDRYRLHRENIRLTEDLKRKNDELRKFNDTLEELVADRTYELKKSMDRTKMALEGIIQAVAVTMETRDPYTAGHQRRTADLACAMGSIMGLDDFKIEGIRLAATIHDIGKISVPAELLAKPTRLSDIEMELIRFHVKAGYEILKGIDFPWPVARILLQHHERMDGSGYPNGLRGGDIQFEARIMAVADVVEAMASNRPYRSALGIDAALGEIRKNSGRFYEPAVVDACLALFNEKKFAFKE